MRSQKIRNKAPRPFKNHGIDQGWSGGNKKDFLPPKKVIPALKKPGAGEAEASSSSPASEAPSADQ